MQITHSGSLGSTFQLTNVTHVNISGIEVDDIDISLIGTENATLHRVVIDGSWTAISLMNTEDTNITHCQVRNTGWTGVIFYGSYNTNISNTTIKSTGREGLNIKGTEHSLVLNVSIKHTRSNTLEEKG